MKLLNVAKALSLIAPIVSPALDPNITPSIETSSVNYDLRVMYGGDHPESFDLNTLLYDDEKELYENFNFLEMKPVKNNLYAYLRVDDTNLNYLKGSYEFKISKGFKSNTSKEDSTSYYPCRVINSYGYSSPNKPGSTFVKIAFDNILSSDLKSVKVDTFVKLEEIDNTYDHDGNGIIDPWDVDTKTNFVDLYQINESFKLNDENDDMTSSEDFVYKYFDTDVIKILDKEVGAMQTDYALNIWQQLCGTDYKPCSVSDWYCFFNTDHDYDINDLLTVSFTYQKASFNCFTGPHVGSTPNDYEYWNNAYNKEDEYQKNRSHTYGKTEEYALSYYNKTINKGTTTKTSSYSYLSFWQKEISFNVENIQNCKDLTNLENIGTYTDSDVEVKNDSSLKGQDKPDEHFKKFIGRVQSSRKSNGKDLFSWAFLVDTTLTDCKPGSVKGFHGYWHHLYDIKQVEILKLQYKDNQGVIKEVNTIDEPTDASFVNIYSYIPYTLGDWLQETFNTATNWFKKILIIVASILGGLLIFFLIYKLIKWIIGFNQNRKINKLYKESKDKKKKDK